MNLFLRSFQQTLIKSVLVLSTSLHYFTIQFTPMKENLKRYLNPSNLLAFVLWASVMAIIIYWNNTRSNF